MRLRIYPFPSPWVVSYDRMIYVWYKTKLFPSSLEGWVVSY